MSFSDQITKNHLLKAIESIDEKGLQGYPNSSTYDIIHNEKRYPPKTVIAIASELVDGIKIKTTSFNGGEKTKAFKVLDENGFKIETKKLKEDQTENALIDYVQTFENWKWCEEFFQILGHLINRINFVNNDPRIAFTLVKKKKRISINVGGRLVFAIYRTNDENWFWFVLNEADTEKARTLSEYMIGGREEKFASGTAALLIPFKPGLSDKSMKWIINAWIKAVEDQMPSVTSAGQPEKHNDFIYKAAIDIEYRTQLLKKIGKPMKPFKIYKIAESASPNSQILIAPKRKYFYWDNKDFKKNKIGDLVIFINLTKRQALWTEINVLGIKTDFNDITKKTSFTHNDELYEVDGNGKWNKFIQFKILTEQAIPQDWNWTKQIGASSVYDLWKTGIEKHKDRIDKINDLKGIFHEKNEVKIMDDYIIKLEEKLNLKSNNHVEKNKTLTTKQKFDITALQNACKDAGLVYTDQLTTRFVSSLLTKPFVILTGLSGSGKTKLAQAFVQWISQEESQYCIIPVGADWTNREPLLGYPNALKPEEYVKPDSGVIDLIIQANSNPELPYFLILDEMNLSNVERYFADFLSVMESNEYIPLYAEGTVENGVPPKLKVPSNLFIIGTVNIDETTNMFSPKVLDRASTIEFRINSNEMKDFFDTASDLNMKALLKKGVNMAQNFINLSHNKSFTTKDRNKINKTLLNFFGELQKTGAEFGYRSATEILRLINQLSALDNKMTTSEKIDIAIMQKLLPKLHGSRRKLSPVLEILGGFCVEKSVNVVKDVFGKEDFVYSNEKVLYPMSLEKIVRMYKGAIDNGFASFAEA